MPVNQLETHPQLQSCLHLHHPQRSSNALTLGVENVQWKSNKVDKTLNDFTKNGKNSGTLQGTSEQIEGDREEIQPLWQRMKWTDEMVKLLITAVAYVGEYVINLTQHNKNQMKGKWKAISHVMVQRGYLVSPQQCEDKFNDLNKKYRRLNEILGIGTAFDVVENPSVLDSMDLSDETAEEIIKILSSKQLFYQEMCSYHNRTKFFLLHDEDLERSLHLAIIKGKDKIKNSQDLSHDEKLSTKRMREGEDRGIVVLEEQKGKLEEQRLKLEKKRLKWIRYCQHEDWKLEKMRLENKLMKLQNQLFSFELESHIQGRKM